MWFGKQRFVGRVCQHDGMAHDNKWVVLPKSSCAKAEVFPAKHQER